MAVFFVAAILCSFRMPGSARTCQSYWYKGLEVDVWSKPFYAGIWSTAHAAFQVQNNRRKQECFAHADAFGLVCCVPLHACHVQIDP